MDNNLYLGFVSLCKFICGGKTGLDPGNRLELRMLTPPGDSVCVRLTYKMAKFRSKSFANVQFDLDIKGTLPSSRLPGVIKEQLMSFSYKFAGDVPIQDPSG